jgi:hypothetical protein
MKKIKLMTIIAVAGLVGFAARAAVPLPYDLVTVKLTALFQTNNTDTTSKIIKVKITNKDILSLIASEFTNSAAAITNKGAKLAVDSFFDGTFAVLDKTNGVILADASTGISTNDDYELFIEQDGNSVDAFNTTGSKDTHNLAVVGFFEFENANDTIFGDTFGAAGVKEKFTDTKDSESFVLAGTEDVEIGGRSGVLTGRVSGTGKDNDNIDF